MLDQAISQPRRNIYVHTRSFRRKGAEIQDRHLLSPVMLLTRQCCYRLRAEPCRVSGDVIDKGCCLRVPCNRCCLLSLTYSGSPMNKLMHVEARYMIWARPIHEFPCPKLQPYVSHKLFHGSTCMSANESC